MPTLRDRIGRRVRRLAQSSVRRAGTALDALSGNDKPREPLMEAARAGDIPLLETLMASGADPDTRDRQGRTALHHAVASSQFEAAACLLGYGADHRIADILGRRPLGLAFTDHATLHAVRQRYQRFRRRSLQNSQPDSSQVREWLADLSRHGVIRVSGLVNSAELAQLRHDFSRFLDNLNGKLASGSGAYQHYFEEEHFWEADQAYISNNAFKYSPELVRLCCKEPILQLVKYYMGRNAHISRGVAMRYLPVATRANDMFGWHHDLEDKRLKMMILLTDVDEGDQCMSYVMGSQRLFHPLDMFRNNSCSLDYCRHHLSDIRIFDTLGKAGDIFLFDPNGAHRGNRRPDASIRDAFFVEYTTDMSNLWGTDLDPATFDGLDIQEQNPFVPLMKADKKWQRRTTRDAPSWIENLERVESWL